MNCNLSYQYSFLRENDHGVYFQNSSRGQLGYKFVQKMKKWPKIQNRKKVKQVKQEPLL